MVKTNNEVTQYTRVALGGQSVPLSRPAALEPQSKLCEARANVSEDEPGVTPRGRGEPAIQTRLSDCRNIEIGRECTVVRSKEHTEDDGLGGPGFGESSSHLVGRYWSLATRPAGDKQRNRSQ